ncbi:S8 family serine peptidase [Cellulomonas endophytica]|uniref:S8 family serine peptidase n=1 Tax=Cellulomonas endophytica TaxID=2494735 RepID=UPI001011E7AE|nr:S8 family serine peptidase [Cellulomonas endophytica]
MSTRGAGVRAASVLGCLVMGLLGTAVTAQAAAPAGEARQRYVVQLRPGAAQRGLAEQAGAAAEGVGEAAVGAAAVASAVASVAAEETARGAEVEHVYSRAMEGFSAELTAGRAEALRRDPRVLAVTPDARVGVATTQVQPPWGLDRIDQRGAVVDGSYSYGRTGAGVTVFVVDTGVRATHQDLVGRVRSGWDFVDDDADASDCDGHGTHVAGTVAGTRYGVAKGAQVVALRVFDCTGNGDWSDVIAAVDWAIAHRSGPSVLNFSGSGGAYAPVDSAVARAVAAGITTVVAAGNDDTDACTASPARSVSALTVGATAEGDARAWFSNTGSCLDLFAPGDWVLSSSVDADDATTMLSGTSMAAPHVAGAAALHLQGAPAATPAQVTAALLGAATPGVVTDSRSAGHDGLLHVAPPPAATTAAAAPTGVTAVAGDATATVRWTAGDASAVTGWTVTAQPGGTVVHPAAAARSVAVPGLTNGTAYTFTVRAETASGPGTTSAPSAPVTPARAAVTVPGVPASVAVTTDHVRGTATLTWAPPAQAGGAAVTGYRVTRDGSSVTGGGAWASTLAATARSQTFTGLVPGATYRFTVQAVNTVGTGTAGTATSTLRGTSRTVTVTAGADTMARQYAPNTVSGGVTPLLSDVDQVSGRTSRVTSYLRFTVPSLAAGEQVLSSRLGLTVTDGTSDGPKVWRTGTSWTEGTLSWNVGRPATTGTAPVADLGALAVGRVTTPLSGVTGAGAVSLALVADSTDGLALASRESATTGQRPALVLLVGTRPTA